MRIEIARRGLLLVLSSPSGAGKTTLARRLLAEESGLVMSVSATTRAPRPGERDGVDYRFVSAADFAALIQRQEFLEHAEVFGHRYGTPRAPVEAALRAGGDILFDIDWQGTQQLKQTARDDLVSIFILPPSAEELHARLRTRAQDSEAVVDARMARASDEISHWPEYDYVIVNDSVEPALARIRAILAAERLRRDRQTGLFAFVKSLRDAL